MAKLKKNHFYYGAILDALCQYNPDASPILMSHEEEPRQVYKVMTNTMYIVFQICITENKWKE